MRTLLCSLLLLAPLGGCQIATWGSDVHEAQYALSQSRAMLVDLMVAQNAKFTKVAVDRDAKVDEVLAKYNQLALAVEMSQLTDKDGNVKAPASQVTKLVDSYIKRSEDRMKARYEFKGVIDTQTRVMSAIATDNTTAKAKEATLQENMRGVKAAQSALWQALGGLAGGVGLSFAF